MPEDKLMRVNLWISIISPVFVVVFFLFNTVADERISDGNIEQNKIKIEKIEKLQDEQCDDIQKNKETTIEIKGEIKNINDKLDTVKEMIKDIKTNLDNKDK